ncbi:C40 family peptidase [Bhargavaea ullalensis]|uniref:S-layer homology domain-containing protein n=1 Tax=Bhargavaea ullalensis TaxID=1265685 RepID=A0ABV2GAT3_9BACL
MKRLLFILSAVLVISGVTPHATEAATTATQDTVISTAKKYLGVPYKYGGTTTAGIDCSAYTQLVYKNVGVSIPRTSGAQYNSGKAVAKSNLQVGDLVFFNTSGKGVSHVGIYIGSNSFIQASTSRGVTITSLSDPYYWGSKYIGARRIVSFPEKAPVEKAPDVAQTAAPNPAAKPITRLQAAEAIVKELGIKAKYPTATYFKDIPGNHPQLAVINAVYEAGIFTGSEGNFNPDSGLSRAQMAKILVESFHLEGSVKAPFKDVPADSWAAPYVNTLYYNNVTTGYTNGPKAGTYGLNEKVSRTQLGKFMDRL